MEGPPRYRVPRASAIYSVNHIRQRTGSQVYYCYPTRSAVLTGIGVDKIRIMPAGTCEEPAIAVQRGIIARPMCRLHGQILAGHQIRPAQIVARRIHRELIATL